MHWIILIAGLTGIIFICKQLLQSGQSWQQNLRWFAYLLVLIVILLVLTGKAHWLGVLLAGIIPLLRQSIPWLIRLFPWLQQYHQRRQFQQQPNSQTTGPATVTTAILSMQLDQAQGTLTGKVLAGPFSGQALDELTKEQIKTLYEYCLQQDNDSAALLESYVQFRFGEQWSQQHKQQQSQTTSRNNTMSKQEAYEILGLSTGASNAEIKTAHRRLMQKLHPDHGGSTFLAAQINQAKKILLGK